MRWGSHARPAYRVRQLKPGAHVQPAGGTDRFRVLQGLVQLRVGHDRVPFADTPQHPLERFHLALLNEAGHKPARTAAVSQSHVLYHAGAEGTKAATLA